MYRQYPICINVQMTDDGWVLDILSAVRVSVIPCLPRTIARTSIKCQFIGLYYKFMIIAHIFSNSLFEHVSWKLGVNRSLDWRRQGMDYNSSIENWTGTLPHRITFANLATLAKLKTAKAENNLEWQLVKGCQGRYSVGVSFYPCDMGDGARISFPDCREPIDGFLSLHVRQNKLPMDYWPSSVPLSCTYSLTAPDRTPIPIRRVLCENAGKYGHKW